MSPENDSAEPSPPCTDAQTLRHNICVESFFSAFNGIFLGLAIFAAPVVAVTGVEATPLELTILVSAFPIGAFLGPLWAWLGRRLGMKQLVVQMAIWANVPLLLIFFVKDAAWFTALVSISQLLNSAMRMGQSSLYRVVYPKEKRGWVLGWLTFWTYVTMVPTILLTGWLLDKSRDIYQVLYPLAGVCGLVGCWYYHLLIVPPADSAPPQRLSFKRSVQRVERILAQDRVYLLFQFAFFLSGSAFFMSSHVILLLSRERFQFSAFELALVLSVLPQLLLALGSPLWGQILDRVGMVRCRLLISFLMTAYLASYAGGLAAGWVGLIYLGSLLQGLSNGGGQLTWALASSHFAPRAEDVPLYNGIHFMLNGVRGLLLPWVGSILFVLTGVGAVVGATVVSLASVPILWRAVALTEGQRQALRRAVEPGRNTEPASPACGGGGRAPVGPVTLTSGAS